MVATEVAALTYQIQSTQSTAANSSQCQDQQMAHIATVQNATHDTLHHVIAQLNTLSFNASDAGRGRYVSHGYGRQGCGRTRPKGRGHGPPAYIGSFPQGGGFPPTMTTGGCHLGGFPPGPPGGFLVLGGPTGGPLPYRAPPPTMNRGYGQPGGIGIPPGPLGVPPAHAHVHQQPYSNVVKHYSNWNTCYSCGFDVADGHTSMLCPLHLRKDTHDISFNRRNSQQYINLGHPCSMRHRHKIQFLAPM
jgi:hypothetical protein